MQLICVDEQNFGKLRKEYNGYCFGMDVDTGKLAPKVYNPFALNYVFADQQMLKKWFISATPSALVTKLKEKDFIGIDTTETTVLFSTINASSEPDKISALNMLYYAGYLTIRAYDPDEKRSPLIIQMRKFRQQCLICCCHSSQLFPTQLCAK